MKKKYGNIFGVSITATSMNLSTNTTCRSHSLGSTPCRKKPLSHCTPKALCECERRSVPKLGIATDRRALNHVGEVFREDNISTLICFICNCKHICHGGYDKFGTEYGKGTICFRPQNEEETKLLADMFNNDLFWEFNLSSTPAAGQYRMASLPSS